MGCDSRRLPAVLRALALGYLSLVVASPALAQVTITVNTTADENNAGDITYPPPGAPAGTGISLREAIQIANLAPAGDGRVTIAFDGTVFLPNQGTTIVLGSALPAIARGNTTVDGEVDDNGIADVRLNLAGIGTGNGVGAGAGSIRVDVDRAGIEINNVDDVTIEGLTILNGPRYAPAVWIRGGDQNRVVNCDFTGNHIGILTNLTGGRCFIGSVSPGSDNNFSTHTLGAIVIDNVGAASTTTVQNGSFSSPMAAPNSTQAQADLDAVIGLNATITIVGSGHNTIGGTVAGAANSFTGTQYNHSATTFTNNGSRHAINIEGTGDNTIQQNNIVQYPSSGIRVTGPGNNLIGGSTALAGNTIRRCGACTGNFFHAGIYIAPTATGTTTIQGNEIGTDDSSTSTGWVNLSCECNDEDQGNPCADFDFADSNVDRFDPGAGSCGGTTQDEVDEDGNGGSGIFSDAPAGATVQIGGPAAAAQNIIYGNGRLRSSESKSGIEINGNGTHVIENNLIGIDADGQVNGGPTDGNLTHGVNVVGDGNNRIGGLAVSSRNVIAGNVLNGIRISGGGDNEVQTNYIGTLPNGLGVPEGRETLIYNDVAEVPNPFTGNRPPDDERTNALYSSNGVNGIIIEAAASGANLVNNSLISGNSTDGVTISGSGNNTLFGNVVGLDAAGTGRLANRRHGVAISSNATGDNVIGGSAPGQRNVISGNNAFGISVEGNSPNSSANTIAGNFIGISVDATAALGNLAGGIGVDSVAQQTIGGEDLGEGNVIAGNDPDNDSADGIELAGSGNHRVLGNIIGAAPTDLATFPQPIRLTGAAQFANGGAGILIDASASGDVTIGFADLGGGNIGVHANYVVNNGKAGIEVAGSGTAEMIGNRIGVAPDSTGVSTAMPNGDEGILLSGSGSNTIGRLNAGAIDLTLANVVSGNADNGVSVPGGAMGPTQTKADSTVNLIQGNLIGTGLAGNSAVPNGTDENTPGASNGLAITSTAFVDVITNVIAGNVNSGLYFFGSGVVEARGNRIGLSRDGTLALANGRHGVYIPPGGTGSLLLGAAGVANANVIAGNGDGDGQAPNGDEGDGVHLEGGITNTLTNNLIGLGPAGTTAFPNARHGLFLRTAAGATTTVTDSTISGNTDDGAQLRSGQILLQNNRIGTTVTGNTALGNGGDGVEINDTTLPGLRQGMSVLDSTISGNLGTGVRVVQGGGNAAGEADDILIQGNSIGLGSNGTASLGNGVAGPNPNTSHGVHVEAGVEGKVHIGGAAAGEGNLISGNSGWGVRYESSAYSTLGENNQPVIYNNTIGTSAGGLSGLGNGGGGVFLNTGDLLPVDLGVDGATVGRVGGAPANVISGNGGPGVRVADASAATIVGNLIGTSPDGTAAQQGGASLGNGNSGVQVDAAFSGPLTIGGASDDVRNVIAGSGAFGIDSNGTGNVLIQNNLLGAREPGLDAFPAGGGNALGGIDISGGGPAVTVDIIDNIVLESGGANTGIAVAGAAAEVNLTGTTVSDSVGTGINVSSSAATVTIDDCLVTGNGFSGIVLTGIGANTVNECEVTDNGAAGTTDLESAGIVLNGTGAYVVTRCEILRNALDGVFIAASGAQIGLNAGAPFLTSSLRNTISEQGRHGVTVSSGIRNLISGNVFRLNAGLPINLVDAGDDAGGVTLNDVNDVDAGPNTLLNHPVLEPLVDAGGGTYTIRGVAPGAALVQLYEALDDNPRDTSPDVDQVLRNPDHRGEVRRLLAEVVPDPDGSFEHTTASGDISKPARPLATALAIDADGNTSEFARNAGVLDTNNSGVDVSPSAVQVDAQTPGVATITVTVVDIIGTPVPGFGGVAIVATDPVPLPSVVEVTPPVGTEQVTDANGQVTATALARAHENCPDQVTFSATVNGVPVNDSAPLTFTTGAAQAGLSTIEVAAASPPDPIANGRDEAIVEITIMDNSDPDLGVPCPVPGISFDDLEIYELDNRLTESDLIHPNEVTPGGVTGADGKAFARIRTVNAGQYSIGFRLNGVSAVDFSSVPITTPVAFGPNLPDPDASSLTVVADDPLLANGVATVNVTIRLVDDAGEPIEAVQPDEFDLVITPAAIAGAIGLTGPLNATDSNGETTFSFTSNQGGPVSIAVTVVREDGDGNPANNPSVTLADTADATFQGFFTQSYGPGLHMMGIAGVPVDPSPPGVLAPLVPDIDLARWNPGTESYDVFANARQAGAFDMTAGVGFWLLLDRTVTLTVPGDPTVAATFDVPLQNGWNQVANPFTTPFNFDLEAIEVFQNGARVGTLDSAAAQALVAPYAWRWDPVLQYLLVLDPDTAAAGTVVGQVSSGRAWFWLCRGNGVSVRLRASAAARTRARAAATPGSWLASLEATSATGSAQALFGASNSRLRAELPPQSPQPASLAIEFRDNLGRSATDVRQGPVTSHQSWTVEVTSQTEGEVTLSWKGLARALPEGHRLYLVDPQTEQRVLMNSRQAYTYVAGRGSRQFVLELDPRGEKLLNITDLNPGVSRGRGRGMGMSVTITAPARLVAQVKGSGGRIVRRFEVFGNLGTNSLDWDGRDDAGRPVPSGTYQIEITALDGTGDTARAVRTVVIQ